MNNERKSRIESKREALDLARRRGHGAQIIAGWVAALKEACGVETAPEDFLTLEETEKLREKFFDKVKNKAAYFYQFWPPQAFGEVETLLRVLSFDVYDFKVVLFSDVDKYIGAATVPAGRILVNAQAVWRIVKDDLCVTSPDLQHGLCLEHNFYNEAGDYSKEGFYELTAWGALVPQNA